MADQVHVIEFWRCLYDAPCRAKNCHAKATQIARSMDSGGRPLRQYEVCDAHAAQVAEREKGRGREVVKRQGGS
jgi:hypothetical protein